MRILHTSDWHVGRQIRGRSRSDEFEAVLDEIVTIARTEQVDLVVIAGDIFDHRVPPADAEKLVYDTLLRLRGDGAQVVAIAGNHESQPRLHAVSPLFLELGIHLVTRVSRPEDGGVLEIPSRDGSELADLACVPFIAERRFGDAAEIFADASSWPTAYAEGVGHLLDAYANAMRPNRVHLLTAHLFAAGAAFSGSEREVTLGPNYAVPASAFPPSLSYVALGHIHRAQKVSGARCPVRYSGSPLMLDFGEEADHKGVEIVDVRAGKPAAVTTVRLTRGRKLRTLRGDLPSILDPALDTEDAYLRIEVDLLGPMPGLADQIRDRHPNAVTISPRYPEAPELEDALAPDSTPRERFERYLRTRKGYEEVALLMTGYDELVEGAEA